MVEPFPRATKARTPRRSRALLTKTHQLSPVAMLQRRSLVLFRQTVMWLPLSSLLHL
jgi:hypothetical protein